MGCAGSVPNQNANGVNAPAEAPARPATSPNAPAEEKKAPNPPPATSEAKYYKGNPHAESKETASLFCDDDGCATIATTTGVVHDEDNTSAHRYVDFVARERRSIAQSASEPSAFAIAISHKYRVARAYVKYGITGDCEQYQDEVDKAVPIFGSRAKHRVWEWLSNVMQAPPRGTRVETVKLFKRVQRGSVMSLSGNTLPDIRRTISIKQQYMSGPSTHATPATAVHDPSDPKANQKDATHTLSPDDVLDELLMGAMGTALVPNNANKGATSPQGQGGFNTNVELPPSGSHPHGSPPARSVEVTMDASTGIGGASGFGSGMAAVDEEGAFLLPDNYGLVADNFAVGTVIGVDGDNNQYDLVVVEAETQVLEDEVGDDQAKAGGVPHLSFPAVNGDNLNATLLTPHYLMASTSSHRDTSSSLNDQLDYMSVSDESIGFNGHDELLGGNTDGNRQRTEGANPLGITVESNEEILAALENDPICRSIHLHNSVAQRPAALDMPTNAQVNDGSGDAFSHTGDVVVTDPSMSPHRQTVATS